MFILCSVFQLCTCSVFNRYVACVIYFSNVCIIYFIDVCVMYFIDVCVVYFIDVCVVYFIDVYFFDLFLLRDGGLIQSARARSAISVHSWVIEASTELCCSTSTEE